MTQPKTVNEISIKIHPIKDYMIQNYNTLNALVQTMKEHSGNAHAQHTATSQQINFGLYACIP